MGGPSNHRRPVDDRGRRQAVPLQGHDSVVDEPVGRGEPRCRHARDNADVQIDLARCAVGSQERPDVGSDQPGEVAEQPHAVQAGARNSRNGDCRLLHLRRVRGLDAFRGLSDGVGGGPGFVLGGKDASHDSRPVGGMGAIYRPITAEIGDALTSRSRSAESSRTRTG